MEEKSHMRWHMSEHLLLVMLRRAHRGEDPDMLLMEYAANAEDVSGD